jgi:hypothetical protein
MFEFPVLARFLATGALASVIGGILLGNPWSQPAGPPPAQASRSSQQMMQLMRDEHGLVESMVKAQVAAEAQPTAPGMGANRGRTAAGDRKRVAMRSTSH